MAKKERYCKSCGIQLNKDNDAVIIKVFRKEIRIPTGYCKKCARHTRDTMQEVWDRKKKIGPGLREAVGDQIFGKAKPNIKKVLKNQKSIDKIIKKAKKKGLNTKDIEKGIGIFKELNDEKNN